MTSVAFTRVAIIHYVAEFAEILMCRAVVSSDPIRFALGCGRQRILDFQPIIYAA
jgi:hypothetical protein